MSTDPMIGKKLGDYTIEGILGAGGMARVYRGYDEKLDRFAAVKVIEPNLVANDYDEEYRERFLREARSIARLNHPNIVGIYQFNQVGSIYYIAMAFVEGDDLRHILKDLAKQEKLFSRERIISITRDIANALDYTHKQSIIHRDIKPSNIIITPEGRAVLTDFGLALNAIEGTIGNTFGSVHYIAPEQAVSSAQAVPQSDLYSLGVVLYEMLTGRVPFDDASAMSVALKHISDPPPPPTELNPNIPPEVEQVVMKVLDKDPQKRYPSGHELITALEAAFASAPPEDGASRPTSPVAKPTTSRPSVTPTHNLDAPTITDSNRKSFTVPPGTGLMNNRNLMIGGAVAVVALLIIGILFINITNTNSANATSTAVAQAQLDATATQAQFNIVASSTAVAIENATATQIAENEQATQTAIAIRNATATQEAENERATQTAIAIQNATATREAEIANITATAEENATATQLSINLDNTATQIADNFLASQTAQARANAAATQTAVALIPTNTPTNLPPTPTYTPSPTLTPSSTPTPQLMADELGEAQLLLRYDGNSVILSNRGPSGNVNLRNLVFVQFAPNESGALQESARFRIADQTFATQANAVAPRRCLQIWDDERATENPMENGLCVSVPFWVTTQETFWMNSATASYFEVRFGEIDVLGTCQVAIPNSFREVRCVIPLP